MAKKKSGEKPGKTLTLADKQSRLDSVIQSINDQSKQIICGRMSDPAIEGLISIKFLPTASPDFNQNVGGGIPMGRLTIISGEEDSGKTGFMLNTIGNLMADRSDFVAVWLESENSITKEYALKTFHIDPDRFVFLDMDKLQGGEKTLDDLLDFIKTGAVDLCVINSLRAVTPKSEMTKEMDKQDVAAGARMNSKFMSKAIPIIAEHQTAMVAVQQRTANISGYGAPTILSGGKRIRFQSMLTVKLQKVSIQDSDPIKSDEGIKISVIVEKNHCNPRFFPYRKFVMYAIFDEGIETALPALQLAIDQGVLRRSGAHIYWDDPDSDTPRFHWTSKADYRGFMKEHPEVFKELLNKIQLQSETLSDEEVQELQKQERDEAREAGVTVDEPDDITAGVASQDVL